MTDQTQSNEATDQRNDVTAEQEARAAGHEAVGATPSTTTSSITHAADHDGGDGGSTDGDRRDAAALTGRARSLANLKPFKRGRGKDRDPRAWVGGRPSTFDDFRQTLIDYLNTPTKKNRTRLTTLIDKMANTRGERKTLLEYAFGRVPTTVDTDPSGKAMSWGEFIRAAFQGTPSPSDRDVVDADQAELGELTDDRDDRTDPR